MNLRTRYSVIILITAAVLLGVIISVHFFYMNKGMEVSTAMLREVEMANADMQLAVEKQLVTLKVQHYASAVEHFAVRNQPDSIFGVMLSLINSDLHITECGVCFKPYYFKSIPHRSFQPVAVHSPDSIYNNDYGLDTTFSFYQREWFVGASSTNQGVWTKVYHDYLTGNPIQTYGYPIHGANDTIIAVLYADLPMWWMESINKQSDAVVANYRQNKNHLIFFMGGLVIVGLLILFFICWRAARAVQMIHKSNEQRMHIENDIHVASEIQMGMIPKDFTLFSGRSDVDVYASIKPAKQVGGDLYDFFIRDKKLFFCIGDVAGKGIPASLMMAVTRSLFRTEAQHSDRAECIVSSVNNSIMEMNQQGIFVTFFVGVLDLATGHLNYCNAGHNAPLLLPSKTWLDVIPNLALGVLSGFEYQGQHFDMAKDSMLFLYTDGLNEAENASHGQFGVDGMLQVELPTLSSHNRGKTFITAMQEAVHSFVDGTEQSDDLTMMSVSYHGTCDFD